MCGVVWCGVCGVVWCGVCGILEISLGIAIGIIFSKILSSFRTSCPEVFNKKMCS